MAKRLRTATVIEMLLIALVTVTPSFGQSGPGGRGMMGDASHMADMQLFHQLFEHRTEINRQVIERADGIETVTESKNPEVTRLLQAHVASMLARVKGGTADSSARSAVLSSCCSSARIRSPSSMSRRRAVCELSRRRRTHTWSSYYAPMRRWSARFSRTVCRK